MASNLLLNPEYYMFNTAYSVLVGEIRAEIVVKLYSKHTIFILVYQSNGTSQGMSVTCEFVIIMVHLYVMFERFSPSFSFLYAVAAAAVSNAVGYQWRLLL